MKTLITRNAEHSILKYIMVGLILGCLYMLFVHFVSAPAFALLYALPVGIVAGLVPFVCKEFSNHAEKSALDEMVQDGIDVDNLPEEAILGLEGRIFFEKSFKLPFGLCVFTEFSVLVIAFFVNLACSQAGILQDFAGLMQRQIVSMTVVMPVAYLADTLLARLFLKYIDWVDGRTGLTDRRASSAGSNDSYVPQSSYEEVETTCVELNPSDGISEDI